MKTTGDTAAVLTNLFGGSINNEGMGLFSLSFDWQYVRTSSFGETKQETDCYCRSLPSTHLFLSSCRSMPHWDISSASPPCLASITPTPGSRDRFRSCQRASSKPTAQRQVADHSIFRVYGSLVADLRTCSTPSPMSSPAVCSTRPPWLSTASPD